MFGRLLERPLLARDVQQQYPRLISMFDKELDCCKCLYDQHMKIAEEQGERPKWNFKAIINMSQKYEAPCTDMLNLL